MAFIMVDVETDGPIPGDYSLVSFAAILVRPGLEQSFYARLKPISDRYEPDALAVSGHSRQETLGFEEPKSVMERFEQWLLAIDDKDLFFISDNPRDWMFICWYFYHFLDRNPFDFNAQLLSSLYKGLVRDMFENFHHLKTTQPTHHPLDDARGNAEALLRIKEEMGLGIRL